jgi:hypothetical protein
MKQTEFQTAVERLQALPEQAKADIGPKLNQYLNKLDDLRGALKSGHESGPAKPADGIFDRLESKYRGMAEGADNESL